MNNHFFGNIVGRLSPNYLSIKGFGGSIMGPSPHSMKRLDHRLFQGGFGGSYGRGFEQTPSSTMIFSPFSRFHKLGEIS